MKTTKKTMAAMIVASLIIAGSAYAVQQAKADQSTNSTSTAAEMPKHDKKHDGPLEMLGRFQFENVAAQTLSELTSQSLETITAKLKDSRLPKVLSEYSISMDTFKAAMKPKFVAIVQKRVDDGSITAEQQALILEALEKNDNRREIMEKLIQNGVTAGIITQEEADKMLSRMGEEPPAE